MSLAEVTPETQPAAAGAVPGARQSSSYRRYVRPSKHAGERFPLVPLLFGLGFSVYADIGGHLYLSEFVALVAAPVLIVTRPKFAARPPFAIVAACSAWAIGVVLSAFANEAGVAAVFPDLMAIAVLVATIIFVASCCRTLREFEWLAWGFVVAGLISVRLQPVQGFDEEPWKFGIAVPVSLGICLIAARVRRTVGRLALLLLAAGLNLAGDFRSLALVLTAVALTDMLRVIAFSRWSPNRSAVARGAAMIAIVAVAGVAIAASYATVARTGLIGEQAQVRLEQQGGGAPIFMLLAGRYEIFFSLPAAMERPVIGYGPNPIVNPETVARSRQALADRGLEAQVDASASDEVIPIHSATMSAWITGGILGLAAWLTFIFIQFRGATYAAASRAPFSFVGALIYLGIWSSLYSPFGGNNRAIVALALAVALMAAGAIVRNTDGEVSHG